MTGAVKMNVRKLFDLADKEASVDYSRLPHAWPERCDAEEEWNPLEDNGDALRLMDSLDVRIAYISKAHIHAGYDILTQNPSGGFDVDSYDIDIPLSKGSAKLAELRPSQTPITQLERYLLDQLEATGFSTTVWSRASLYEIAKAGINAVKDKPL